MGLTVKEHGIYETDDGRFVGPLHEWPPGSFHDGMDAVYDKSGMAVYGNGKTFSLVREVVVGPGWMPWNGGEKAPVEGRVEYVLRNGSVCRHALHSSGLRWTWGDGCGPNNDIVAYRVLKPVETSAPIIKVSAADIDDPSALLAKVSTLAADAEKWRKLLAFMREMEAP